MINSKQKIIIGYPIFDLLAFIFCFAFVALTICFYDDTSAIFFFTVAFFGFGGVVLLFKLLRGKKYISKNSKEAQEFISQKNDRLINGLGDFTYDTVGFTILISNKKVHIAWDDISQIIAFKVDLFSIDEIRLQIHLSDKTSIEFGEEIPGWFQFLLRSKEQFPEIDPLWEVDISNPAFERKETIIYKKLKS